MEVSPMTGLIAAVRATRGRTAADQTSAITAWAAEHGHTVARVITPSREELGEAVRDVRAGTAAGIVCDRLAVLGDVVHQEAMHCQMRRSEGTLYAVHAADAQLLAGAGDDVRELLRAYDDASAELAGMVKGAQLLAGARRVRA